MVTRLSAPDAFYQLTLRATPMWRPLLLILRRPRAGQLRGTVGNRRTARLPQIPRYRRKSRSEIGSGQPRWTTTRPTSLTRPAVGPAVAG